MNNRTFTIIKPCAVASGNTGKIIDRILMAKFKIIALKMIWMTKNQAEQFYSIHVDKPFFHDLIDFMISGPCVVGILEKEHAVSELRKLVGNTDPQKADPGTIRHDFAKSKTANSIHASDSDENAVTEWNYFFNDKEIFTTD
ncbi:MAG: nucleoside-diphosphate kinase [Tannerella sp.]|jgi:nucleoside-diphosphate kinase|nr:nucleoside-diphosphate kinase [Tannerella sp.]